MIKLMLVLLTVNPATVADTSGNIAVNQEAIYVFEADTEKKAETMCNRVAKAFRTNGMNAVCLPTK